MNRREFLRNSTLSAMAVSVPFSVSGKDKYEILSTKKWPYYCALETNLNLDVPEGLKMGFYVDNFSKEPLIKYTIKDSCLYEYEISTQESRCLARLLSEMLDCCGLERSEEFSLCHIPQCSHGMNDPLISIGYIAARYHPGHNGFSVIEDHIKNNKPYSVLYKSIIDEWRSGIKTDQFKNKSINSDGWIII